MEAIRWSGLGIERRAFKSKTIATTPLCLVCQWHIEMPQSPFRIA
jgi:hypothetical protein